MAFQPRLLADGKPCCARTLPDGRLAFPPNACPKCIDHANARRRPAQRAAQDATPPESYKADINALRRQAPAGRAYPSPTAAPRTPLDANGIPDPYAADISKLKETA